jgi:hypothetical protein
MTFDFRRSALLNLLGVLWLGIAGWPAYPTTTALRQRSDRCLVPRSSINAALAAGIATSGPTASWGRPGQ